MMSGSEVHPLNMAVTTAAVIILLIFMMFQEVVKR
jgi:hypothetical protein